MSNELDSLFAEIKKCANPAIKGIQLDLEYSSSVSNSHSCPKYGVRNFNNASDKPTSYPGLTGRIWYRTDGSEYSSFCEPVSGLVHTGTGGYGAYSGKWKHLYKIYKGLNFHDNLYFYSYDCKIFADDFPEILTLAASHIMRSENLTSKKFTYYWLDSEMNKQDIEIQQKYEQKQARRYLNENSN